MFDMFRLPKNTKQSPLKQQQTVSHTPNNTGLCKFPYRKCNLLPLENYNYCLKHILEDKDAPYKPCPYLYTVSGRKCGKAAYRPERKDTCFCAEHSRKTQLLRLKASSRHAPPQTSEALLASLGHYAPKSQPLESKQEASKSENKTAQGSHAVNPFRDINAAQVNARYNQILDYASDTDSDVEEAMLDNVWRAQDHESSDAESIDSQTEEPLKHAGVFTAEEVTVMFNAKLLRLQSLYIDQYRRLQHLLKESRRKYLHALKKEKETLSSIHQQDKKSPKDHKQYQKLKALNHFHKYYGEEAILHKKSVERRAQMTQGQIVRTSHKGKCAFTEGGVKCGVKTLPGTKYCRRHILEDNQQVLFRACGFSRDDHICKEPTLSVFESATCVYHITLPQSPTDKKTVKEEEKHEVAATQNQPETKIDDKLMDLEFQTGLEDQLSAEAPHCGEKQPDYTVNNVTASTIDLEEPSTSFSNPDNKISLKMETSETSNTTKIHEVETNTQKPANTAEEHVKVDEIEMKVMPTEVYKKPTDVNNVPAEINDMSIEDNIIPTEGNERSTDVKEKPIEGNEVQANELKSENVPDELVMVDMMTDVGVVEEVLESDNKPDESMQIELSVESNVQNELEV